MTPGRDPTSGRKVHDDLLVSAALCARLEGEDWGRGLSALIAAADPLAGMREAW